MNVVVIGAGIGGLTAAARLAAGGFDVTVCERGRRPGGKMRRVAVAGDEIDAGPTVFTKRAVFDALFSDCGERLDDHVTITRSDVIARHVFADGARLDLHADRAHSVEAVKAFSGARSAREFSAFMARADGVLDLLDPIFMSAQKPRSPIALTMRAGFGGAMRIARLGATKSFWQAVRDEFSDPRLQCLFARYMTYVGSSPFEAPATLRLIAAVEARGVWRVAGGMSRLAEAVEGLARRRGAIFRYEAAVDRILVDQDRAAGVLLSSGETIAADLVLANCDADALALGHLGNEARAACEAPTAPRDRSLSALGIAVKARVSGPPLAHHTVFFAPDPMREFTEIFKERRLPSDPNVYVCAEDRGDDARGPCGPERLFLIVNAPALSDETQPFEQTEVERCTNAAFSRLAASGLTLDFKGGGISLSTPSEYSALYPGTGGALYGRVSHGSTASFRRPDARSRIPGLYLCGGSAHPGAGVPMASLSGTLAVEAIVKDLASTRRSGRAAMPGGIATRSRTTASSD
ncbi:phytoene desaturase family protein [Fulvimarina sp. 2208YS6-2-32]|uniref:Phytoene desaturase family protein n=1 Tax=Fulvimarina uroteuthidis TaxID=3098149 RepID=A0ABU5I090_9HYPH|nr:1-hydroxycarotenoid 3,4-desaturase CrtD [Fulvimarina sp. 2208YS6-2-32]MDY8108475.1 phytoene desaturase family protein [Fulvimarina sp. 2208YS6-2-32]